MRIVKRLSSAANVDINSNFPAQNAVTPSGHAVNFVMDAAVNLNLL
jgi:type IV secretory pathway ATPase VirB11/archaellum biosynthesis ATPase